MMHDRLTELIKQSLNRHIDKSCNLAENIADDLLSDGVIVPPCKVGDTVWYEIYGEANSAVIYSCIGALTSRGFVITDANAKDSHGLEIAFSGNCLGKTVFLSREEVETALKGADDE